ncbi:MAG: putative 4-hydroxybenzoate polyprenyltransferase [Proteobacteria bacterium]|nr:putative 4-hydroxybenzoate polyprenyltransferase [Pseudomonadota bacterium]
MGFKKFSNLIMIEQTLFALPFAYIGILFADGVDSAKVKTLSIWILATIALIAARTAGMSFNRAIDANIDAKNPRTKDRTIPKGEATKAEVWLIGAVSSVVLIVSSYFLNPLCFYLSFVAVFLLFTYSYFKRFSSSSHFYLGLVEAAAPIGGYLAVTGKFSIVPFILGGAILLWIAGLDIVYALLDKEFDRKEKLYSLPSVYGRKRALTASAACYILSFTAMIAAGMITDKSIPYWLAITCIAFVFIYQQTIARSHDLEQALKKFFKINMYVSPFLLIGTFIDGFF